MKKSSDNTNRPRTLEEVFRDGFEPAEVSPRASIWHHIEQELEVKQAGYYKQRLVWYRSLAVASITLLLVAVSYFWYAAQTKHPLNLPAASTGAPVPENNPETTAEIAKANGNNPAEQANQPQNLRKQPSDQPNSPSRQAEQTANSLNRENNNNNLPAPEVNPARLARAPRQSPEPFFGFAKRNAARDKITPYQSNPGANNIFAPENRLAVNLAQTTVTPDLPTDSAAVVIAKTEPALTTDSAAVIPGAPTPEETQNKALGSRWALGGGTGSQYFEQNIRFANAGTNYFANDPAVYALSAGNNSVGGNTIEAASKEFNENMRPAFSYRAAVAANYRLNDKWSIEAGLNFAENKAQTSTSYIIYKRPGALNRIANIKSENASQFDRANTITANVTIPVTIFLARLTDTDLTNSQVTVEKATPFNMYYRYRQIGVPLRLRYQHGRGKWFNFVQAGAAFNVLLQTSILSDSPKVPAVEYPISQPSPFRNWYITGLGSLGRGLKLSAVWQVHGSIDVAYSFSTLTLSPDQVPNLTQRKPYYVGFGVSSSYVIGKK